MTPASLGASRSGIHRRPRRPVLPPLIVAAAMALASCSDPTGPDGPATVDITGPDGPLTALGQTVELEAVVRDAEGAALPETPVEWSSQDPDVLSVDEAGAVTAEGAGNGRVEARAGDATGSLELAVDPQPNAMDAARGNDQEGTVGEPLADSVEVEVRDAGGHPVEGREVRFHVASGEGSVAPEAAETNSDGRASAVWTLGSDASQEHRLVAETGGPNGQDELQAEFTATAGPAEPASVLLVEGDDQTGFALEPLEDSVGVRVQDTFGNPVPGTDVLWEGDGDGGGDVAPNPAVTDSAGIARAEWTPGDGDGAVELAVWVEGVDPTTVRAEVNPNAIIDLRARGGGSGLQAAELARDAVRWPRVPGSAFADSDAGAFEGVSGEPRALAALAPAGTVDEASAPSGRNSGDDARVHHGHREELLVTLRDDVSPAAGIRSEARRNPERAAAMAAELRHRLGEIMPAPVGEVLGASPILGTVRVRVPAGADSHELRHRLLERDEVERVTPNRTVRAFEPPAAAPTPDPDAPAPPRSPLSQRETVNPLQAWHYRALDLERAWEVERGSEDIVVAVVDDGFRFEHPWLAERWISTGYSFVEEDDLDRCSGEGTVSRTGHGEGPGPDAGVPIRYRWDGGGRCVFGPVEQGGHGMQVAGVIAGASQGDVRGAGVAPEVSLLPVRVLDVAGLGSAYAVAQGILYAAGLPADDGQGGTIQADQGAHVINLSLGTSAPDSLLHEAVQEAEAAGALVVAAAGNQERSSVAYPAGHPEAVGVSAVNPHWELAWYSNHGSGIELAAPGGTGIGGQDHMVWTAEWHFADERPAFGPAQGTSLAAPHVAGVAALVWSRHPELDHAGVRQRLREHAYPLGPGAPNPYYGYGLVDAFWSVTDGAGRPFDTEAILYDAETGRVVDRTPSEGGDRFRFARLDPGRYWLFAGVEGLEGSAPGLPPGPWGAVGAVARPDTMVVEGSGLQEVSLDLSPPVAAQDAEDGAGPDVLPVGGYLSAHLHDPAGAHEYRLPVPEAGTYVVETMGVLGACGLAGQLDTELTVLDDEGTPLDTNSAVDPGAGNYCSYLELSLDPGEYTVRVTSHDERPGLYRIVAR